MKTILIISAAINFILLFFLLRRRRKISVEAAAEIEKTDLKKSDEKKTDTIQSKINQFKLFADGLADEKNNCEKLLSKIASEVQAVQGVLYLLHTHDERTFLRFHFGYAFSCPESKPIEFEMGEGLIGQVAKDKTILNLTAVPVEHIPAISGLGKSVAQYLIICPLVKNEILIGVMELSAFHPFESESEKFIEAATKIMSENLKT